MTAELIPDHAAQAKTEFQQDSLLTVYGTLWHSLPPLQPGWPKRLALRPDAADAWGELQPVVVQLLRNGSIIGFNLGDELIWNCLPPDDLTAAVDMIRASFPRGQAIIWYNEATPVLQEGISQCNKTKDMPMDKYTIPANLDWFSIDMYHMDGPVKGWVGENVRKFYETWIYPNFTSPSQKALLVPGAFGSNVNHFPNVSSQAIRRCL